jgi:hypothetical protein
MLRLLATAEEWQHDGRITIALAGVSGHDPRLTSRLLHWTVPWKAFYSAFLR